MVRSLFSQFEGRPHDIHLKVQVVTRKDPFFTLDARIHDGVSSFNRCGVLFDGGNALARKVLIDLAHEVDILNAIKTPVSIGVRASKHGLNLLLSCFALLNFREVAHEGLFLLGSEALDPRGALSCDLHANLVHSFLLLRSGLARQLLLSLHGLVVFSHRHQVRAEELRDVDVVLGGDLNEVQSGLVCQLLAFFEGDGASIRLIGLGAYEDEFHAFV